MREASGTVLLISVLLACSVSTCKGTSCSGRERRYLVTARLGCPDSPSRTNRTPVAVMVFTPLVATHW